MNKNFQQTTLKLALFSVFALGASSSAYAVNAIYIGKSVGTDNDINTISISQQGAAALNRIGTSESDRFNVEGKWHNINITQTNETALSVDSGANPGVGSPGDLDYSPARAVNSSNGNVITGFIRNASEGENNTATLVQNGDGNEISLSVGGSAKATGTVDLEISQVGDRNSSTYDMNHTGDITVDETTAGDNNIVDVTSSSGTNYSNTISLTGNGNSVTVARSGGFTTTTDDISLIGNLNTVNLSGTASGINALTLASTGNNNFYDITQNGAGSSANINVATNYKNVSVNQATAGSQFSLDGTLTDGGSITITQ